MPPATEPPRRVATVANRAVTCDSRDMEVVRPFLVYRDRIGTPSEIGFLRRQYAGFTRLRPVWIGRTVLPGAVRLGDPIQRLGADGPFGPLRRLLFRYGGVVPRITAPWLGRTPSSPASPTLSWPGLTGPSGASGEADGPLGYDGGAPPHGAFAPVIHAQFARGGALALPLARAQRAGLVVTLHGGDVSKRKNWRHTLLAARWPDLLHEVACFVCVSQAVAGIASSRGVPARKLLVLPIGTEVAATPPPRQPAHYLFVGRFVEKKGIDVLADAMRRLRASGDTTKLVCVGDGPMRPALTALARDVPGIELTGWLPPESVAARMRAAVALIVPSIIAADGDAEGLPSVIPEAMAQGCPVIASAQGGMAEAIADGITGLLTAPNDAVALADAMRLMSADRGLADRLGLNGFNHATETLNARCQSAKLEALLLSVADRQQKAGQ
jgi:glycosyltransferase involved in cell wall biosynthesis